MDDPPAPKPIVTETVRQETKLERESWMLEPVLTPKVPDIEERTGGDIVQDKELPEGYAEPPATRANVNATVDFFATLGTEHRKKQSEPDPTAEVNTSITVPTIEIFTHTLDSRKSVTGSSMSV